MTFKRIAPLAAVLVFAMLAASCANTVRGIGRDVKGTAQAVEDSVQ